MFGFSESAKFNSDGSETERLNKAAIEKTKRECDQLLATLNKEMMANMNANTINYHSYTESEGEDDDEIENAKLLAQAAIDAANTLLRQEIVFDRTVNKDTPQQQNPTCHGVNSSRNPSTFTTSAAQATNANVHRRVVDTKFYDLLGLSPTATNKELKSAYYNKARIYHPDKQAQHSGSKVNNDEKMKLLGDIYNVLSNQKLRLLYDMYGEELVRKCKHKL